MRMVENPLTTARVFVQSASFRRRFRALTVRVKSVKGDQVPTLSLLKWDVENLMNEFLLLVSYVRMSVG